MHCPKCDSENLSKKVTSPFPDGRIELQCRECKQEFIDNKITDKEALALMQYGKNRDEKVIGLKVLYLRYAPWLQKLIQSPRTLCGKIKNVNMPWNFSQEVAEDICDEVFEDFFRKIVNYQKYIDGWKPLKADSINPIQSQLWFIASHKALDFVKTKRYKQQQREVSIDKDTEEHQYHDIETELCLIKCTQKMLELIKTQSSDECYQAVKESINNTEGFSSIFEKCQELLSKNHGRNKSKKRCQCYIILLLQKSSGISTDEIATKIGKKPDATRAFLARCQRMVREQEDPIKTCIDSCHEKL
jgi:DNA-directed RNA polymerase specialized sigma24 family protein